MVKSFHVEKITMNLVKALNPVREDGEIDHRYVGLAKQIVESVSPKTISELNEFKNKTDTLEQDYSRPGLRLVIAVFSQEMEDWQRKAFKKQLRHALQQCGFKPSMTTKLIGAGEYVARFVVVPEWSPDFGEDTEEAHTKWYEDQLNYLRGYGCSALYTISRMSGRTQLCLRDNYDRYGERLSQRELEEYLKNDMESEERNKKKRPFRIKEKNSDPSETSYHLLTEALRMGEVQPVEILEVCIRLIDELDWTGFAEEEKESYRKRLCAAHS